jgi:hypothetical protein
MIEIQTGDTVVVKRGIEIWMPNPITRGPERKFRGDVLEVSYQHQFHLQIGACIPLVRAAKAMLMTMTSPDI